MMNKCPRNISLHDTNLVKNNYKSFYLLHNYKQIRFQMSKNYKYQNNSTNYDMQYILTDMISTYMQKH